MSLAKIRDQFGVPAHMNGKIVFNGFEGYICGSNDYLLRIKIDGDRRAHNVSPRDVEYLDNYKKLCLYCDNPIRNQNKTFCCLECATNYSKENSKNKHKLPKTCPICKSRFISQGKYCGPECRRKGMAKNMKKRLKYNIPKHSITRTELIKRHLQDDMLAFCYRVTL